MAGTSKRLSSFLYSEVFPHLENHEVNESDIRATQYDDEKWKTSKLVWGFSPNLAINTNNVRVENICAGLHHTLFTCNGGGIYSFGNGKHGQLGHGDTKSLVEPRRIEHVDSLLKLEGVTKSDRIGRICAGVSFSCLLLSESGKLIVFGEGRQGELGLGKRKKRAHAPEIIASPGLPRMSDISGGAFHMMGLSACGKVYSWGRNTEGQIGLGTTANFKNVFSPKWVSKVRLPSNNGKVVAVSAGYYHSCALSDAGSVWVWGLNRQFQLGETHQSTHELGERGGPELDDSDSPLEIKEKSNRQQFKETHHQIKCPSPKVLDYGRHETKIYVEISAGGWHTCLLSDDNELQILGGQNKIMTYKISKQIKKVVSGGDRVAILNTDGTVLISKVLKCRPGATVKGLLKMRESPARFQHDFDFSSKREVEALKPIEFSQITCLKQSIFEFDDDIDSILEAQENTKAVRVKLIEAVRETQNSLKRIYAVDIPKTKHWANANGNEFLIGHTDCKIPRYISHVERAKEEMKYFNGWTQENENKIFADYQEIDSMEEKSGQKVDLKLVDEDKKPSLRNKLQHVRRSFKALKTKLFIHLSKTKTGGVLLDNLYFGVDPVIQSIDSEWDLENVGNTIPRDLLYDMRYECKQNREVNVVLEALRGFVLVDKDNSGELDNTEFWLALQYYGQNVSLKRIQKVMDIYDTDGNGTIDESEFVEFALSLCRNNNQNPMRSMSVALSQCISLKTKVQALKREEEFRHFISIFREECVKLKLFKNMPKLLKAKLTQTLRNQHVEKGKLNLSGCGITDSYVIALSIALRVAPVVKHLDLRDNFITTVGASHLLETIIWQRKVCNNFHEQICMVCGASVIFDDPFGELTRGCSCSQPSRGGKRYLHPVFVLESVKIKDIISDIRRLRQAKVDLRRQSFEALENAMAQEAFNKITMETLYWNEVKRAHNKLESDFRRIMSLELREKIATKIFRAIDEDDSGFLSAAELRKAFRNLGMSKLRAHVKSKSVISKIDTTNTGTINLKEFVTYVTGKSHVAEKGNLKEHQNQSQFMEKPLQLNQNHVNFLSSLENFAKILFPVFCERYFNQAHLETDKLVIEQKKSIYLHMKHLFRNCTHRVSKVEFEESMKSFLDKSVKKALNANPWSVLPERQEVIERTLKDFANEVQEYYYELHIQTVVEDIKMGDTHVILLNKAKTIWMQGYHSTPGTVSLQNQVQVRILENIHQLENQPTMVLPSKVPLRTDGLSSKTIKIDEHKDVQETEFEDRLE